MKKDKRCLDYQKLIRQSRALLREGMCFVRLLKSAECSSQAEAAGQIGGKHRATEKLWGKYRQGKLSGAQKQHTCRKNSPKGSLQNLQQRCDYVYV